jgi:hypothetical protein
VADRSEPVSNPAEASSPAAPRRRKRRVWRILGWTAFVLFLLAAAAFITAAIYFRRAEPILRARVIQTLQNRYDSRVELASFGVSVFQGFEVSGGGLKVFPNQLDTQQPLFAVDKFSFRTDWRALLQTPMHIGRVYISGLNINLPPKEQRKNIPKLNNADSGSGKIQILVDELLIDNATLILGTSKPGKVPLDFEISRIRLDSVGAGQPMKFHAILVNPKPVGDIDSSGYFGPFDAHSPGDSPVRGTYTFTHADLGTLKGIAGILSSKGQYSGALNHIVVDGETDTPDFRLTIAEHPVPLHTKFHAIVDGTNGDTYLQPVDAQILNSRIVAIGEVVRAPAGAGHDITLDVTVNPGRIEDMLKLGVKTEPPIMTGGLVLHTKFYLPPGKESVIDKLRLKGNFAISDAHFTNEKVQGKVDELSLRGQGRAQEAKDNSEQGVLVNTASEMSGNFTLGADKLTITDLEYIVPGAHVAMNGVYTLDGNQFDFHGTARLDAKVSQMVTGWKSLLLKPVDPFFSKNGAGTEVPIQVTGTRSEPHFGLDFGHKDEHKEKSASPETPPPAQPK